MPDFFQLGLLLQQGLFLDFQPVDQVEIPPDHPLEQVHPGSKIPEVRRPQQHIQIVHLAVFIDIPQPFLVDFPGHIIIMLFGCQSRLILPDPDFQGPLPAFDGRQFPLGLRQFVLGRNEPFHGISDFLLLLFPLGILLIHLALDIFQFRLLVLDGFRPGNRDRKLESGQEGRQEGCAFFHAHRLLYIQELPQGNAAAQGPDQGPHTDQPGG